MRASRALAPYVGVPHFLTGDRGVIAAFANETQRHYALLQTIEAAKRRYPVHVRENLRVVCFRPENEAYGYVGFTRYGEIPR